MEYDILNEIITGTVATLFTDFGKHSTLMKNSSQMGQDKSEIPKSLTLPDQLESTNGQSSKRKVDSDINVEQWI